MPLTSEGRKRLILSRLGKPRFSGGKLSEEAKKKISIAQIGEGNSMWGRRGIDSPSFGRKHTEETKQKIKIARAKQVTTMESRIKRSILMKQYWKNHPERRNKNKKEDERSVKKHNLKYKLWRKAVFERDNYTCLICGERGGDLNAHHIKSWAKFPALRYDVKNGITLCIKCHYLGRNKEEKQLNLFFQ